MKSTELWKAVTYGIIGNEVCRVTEWVSYVPNNNPKRFTLHPLSGSAPHCGLFEGEFRAYTEQENEAVREMLSTQPAQVPAGFIADEAWSQ